MQVNSIENELVILTKQTLDILLDTQNPSDAIGLYTFYYYTAKWQKTNQPRCTTSYTAQGMKWSETRVRKIKKELIDRGLIEDICQKDENGKISGHYIKLNYIIAQTTLKENHTVENPQYGESDTMDGFGTNALSTNNRNALSTNNLNALSVDNSNALKENIETVVNYLNQKARTSYRASGVDTRKHIKARFTEGFTVDDFKSVINKKCDEWLGTDFEKYLRPSTLFGTKFEGYLNAPEKHSREDDVYTGAERQTDLDGIF